jgi:hypothetical protein
MSLTAVDRLQQTKKNILKNIKASMQKKQEADFNIVKILISDFFQENLIKIK